MNVKSMMEGVEDVEWLVVCLIGMFGGSLKMFYVM